ncbi:MAG: glycosyltransferase [Eubacteriales bacterium]|nr:glycosyltransferase [Eubacteriales bacterium]MDD3199179.1 glycosyltransferase [Eubacteriales bacterium]MDD4629166.1 glycosyltransferase [Eubacteriales bacterium]
MKVLILSISTGQGHIAAGQAIKNAFEQRGVDCEVLDAYEYIEPILSYLVSKGYLLSTAYAKKISSKLYDIVVKKNKPSKKYSVQKITNTVWAKDLNKYIEETKPDVIICTHVLSSILVSIMKEKYWSEAVTVGIVTDFTVHPLWEEARLLDYYVTPHQQLKFQMKKKGLDPAKMLPIGIPIKSKFSEHRDQNHARSMLNLDVHKNTILLMSGSMGYGKIDESIQMLDRLDLDFQVIVVCGNNKKMYKKVKNLATKKRFDIYGYVDNVDVMMDAADCIITKPGGITASEALSKGLPMIMVNPIPGHEMRNVEFMMNNGLAIYATNSFPLDEAVYTLFQNPDRIKMLRSSIEVYRKQNSAQNLCDFLIKQFK